MAKSLASDERCAALTSRLFLKLQDISPSTIFAISSSLALYYYRRQPIYIRRSPLLWAKVCIATCLCLIELSYYPLSLRPLALPLASDATAALLLVGLAYTEHLHSFCSSTLFAIFLVANVADAVEKWRLSVISGSGTLHSNLAGTAVALKLAMVVLQDVSKRHLIMDKSLRATLRERDSNGIFGGFIYSLLKPFLEIGARPPREPEQLRPDLHPHILHQQVMQYWQPELSPEQARSGRLLMACVKAWRQYLLPMMLSRLALTALNCAQPFVLRRLIHTVGKQYTDPASIKECLHLLGIVMFIFYGIALAQGRFCHFLGGYITCFRGGLIALQLEKLQRLPERDAKKAASHSTISSDIDAITTNMSEFIVIPISVAEVGLGSSLLSLFVDAPAAMVCLPIIFAALINCVLARFMIRHVQNWSRNTESRIASTSRILHQLASIKMLGLGPTVCLFMHRLRTAEAKAAFSFQLVNAVNTLALLVADFGVPIAALGVAHFSGFFANEAAIANAFPLIAIVCILKNAIVRVLASLSNITSMASCFSRIERFLNQPERRDCRLTSNSSPTIQSAPPVGNHIRFVYADIAPGGLKKSVLRRVNFALARGSVTGVVGPPGAGKSLLLQAILGRCETLAGSLYVDDTEIGYCGENVWLRDTTIRENIIGHLPYDQARYTRVIQGCFLEEDLNWLPGADKYVVGVNGSSLSDGQRQRIAIARLIYAQHRITLLDDVFRLLDSETAVCILHQLCGRNSILRQAGCTVVLVTSLPQCMNVVDQLLFLDGLGSVTLDRTYRGPPHAQRVVAALNTLNTLNGNVSAVVERRHIRAMQRYLQGSNGPAGNPAIPQQDDHVRQLLAFVINSIGWTTAVLNILAIGILSSAELLPEMYLRLWAEFYPDDPSFLSGYALCNGLLLLIGPAVSFAHHGVIWPRFWVRVHQMFVTTATRSTLPFFEMMNIAELSKMYGQDSIVMAREMPLMLHRFLYAGLEWAFLIGIILSSAEYVGAFLPGIIMTIVLIVRPFLADSRQTHQLNLQTKTAIYTHFEETALGLANIHASHRAETNLANGYRLLEESQRPFYSHLVTFNRLYVGASLLQASIISGFIAIALFSHGAATGISTGHAYIVTLQASWIFDAAIKALQRLDIASDALQRTRDFAKETPLEFSDAPAELPQGWPSSGMVEMQNVHAYYTSNADTRPALLDISLLIEPGEHVSIAGRSGSGKSSLFLALLGFIKYQGSIRIDGVEISSIVPDVLRSRLVTITEEPVIFDGTVRTNLLPFTMNDPAKQQHRRSLDDEQKDLELEQLLKRLHIWIPLISKGGLGANIDDVGYSKGDTQLLCIARAILRQRETGCKVILIDDATSCLATHKETIANDIMRESFQGCTVLRGSIRESGLEGTGAVAHLYHGEVVDPNEVDDDSELDEEEES